MSTYTSEPGTRLAGRYRLVDQVNAGSGWIMWKAMDETLARPVTVLTFAAGFPRVADVVTAARAAGRLSDPRLAQVFDVEDSGQGAYVVMEWVVGDTLEDLVGNGPLDVGRACAMIIDVSRALASAHGVGLAHLCLTPRSLRWTRTSGPKITGLGIDAALAGATLTGVATEDPALADTQGLASLLYAALTGYWPGETQTGLPPAPDTDGGPCTPRQVSPEIPPPIDAVICRALLQRPTRHEPPILTPATFADALAAVAPPVPLPEPAPPAWGAGRAVAGDRRVSGRRPRTRRAGGRRTWGAPAPCRPLIAGSGPSAAWRPVALSGVVAVLVLVAIAAVVWVISNSTNKGSSSVAGRQTASGPGTSSAAASVALKPVSDGTYNAFKPDNNEDSESKANAIDGNPTTAWATQWYQTAQFGGLKSGTGLILDMGKTVKLSQVEVLFSAKCCTSAEIFIGNTNTVSTAAFSSFTKVGSASNVSGDDKFPISSAATGRYVIVWLTSLPPALPSSGAPSGTFQGLIYEVSMRGTPASG